MTSDERALLRAVIEAPADDGPRLIYADWLEEQGRSERAELIRVQCRFAEIAHPDKPMPLEDNEAGWVEWHALKDRADILLRRRRVCWGARLPGEGETIWVRGFPEEIACQESAWLYAGERVCAKAPVRLVELLGKKANYNDRGASGPWWMWCNEYYPGYAASRVSMRIWRHLTPKYIAGVWALYPTEADALADLSRACIAFGRGEASAAG